MIPLEDFFRKPDKVMLRLAPGGEYLAWMEPHNRRLNVTVQDLASGETRRVTHAGERDIGGFAWVSDERLIYVQDSGGDENFRLYAVSRDGANPLDLTPFEGVKCSLVDDLEEDDDHILFQMNKRNSKMTPSVGVSSQVPSVIPRFASAVTVCFSSKSNVIRTGSRPLDS